MRQATDSLADHILDRLVYARSLENAKYYVCVCVFTEMHSIQMVIFVQTGFNRILKG